MTPEISLAPHVREMALTKLREAAGKFHSGDHNGREGAGEALLILRSLAKHALGLSETDPLLGPINALHDGLNRLDDGTVTDLLKPTKRAGPPRASQGEAGVKALAVYTMRMLIELGGDRNHARTVVAKELKKSRFVGRGGRVTERTVREWEEAAQADQKSEIAGLLAILMQMRPIELSGLAPAEAERQLLGRLRLAIEQARSSAILQQKPR